MKKILLLSMLIFTSCGKDGKDGETVFIPVHETPVVQDAIQDDIDELVSLKNEFRTLNGQLPLVKNLMCQLFTITGGDRIQASIAGHNTFTGITSVGYFAYNGPFNQPNSSTSEGMNVLPEPFKSLYQNMYLLRCQGQLVITDSGYHSFELGSDDASLLYINGSLLIDNDNNHGHTVVTKAKLLERGIYAFRLDYAQAGGGNQSLQLKMDGQSIDGALFYR